MSAVKDYRDLIVWQKAMDLVPRPAWNDTLQVAFQHTRRATVLC